MKPKSVTRCLGLPYFIWNWRLQTGHLPLISASYRLRTTISDKCVDMCSTHYKVYSISRLLYRPIMQKTLYTSLMCKQYWQMISWTNRQTDRQTDRKQGCWEVLDVLSWMSLAFVAFKLNVFHVLKITEAVTSGWVFVSSGSLSLETRMMRNASPQSGTRLLNKRLGSPTTDGQSGSHQCSKSAVTQPNTTKSPKRTDSLHILLWMWNMLCYLSVRVQVCWSSWAARTHPESTERPTSCGTNRDAKVSAKSC